MLELDPLAWGLQAVLSQAAQQYPTMAAEWTRAGAEERAACFAAASMAGCHLPLLYCCSPGTRFSVQQALRLWMTTCPCLCSTTYPRSCSFASVWQAQVRH